MIAGLLLVACDPGARARPQAQAPAKTPTPTDERPPAARPDPGSRETPDKTPTSVPEPPPAPAPAPSVSLDLTLSSYLSQSSAKSNLRFILEDGTLSLSMWGPSSTRLPKPGGVDLAYLGALPWELELTRAQQEELAALLGAAEFVHAPGERLGAHVPRGDYERLEVSLGGAVGDKQIAMAVDGGWLDARGEPLDFLDEQQRAQVPELTRRLATLERLGAKLASWYPPSGDFLTLEIEAFENSSDSFSEHQRYDLSGRALSRRYSFGGADGHRRPPAFEDGELTIDDAAIATLVKQLEDGGLFVERGGPPAQANGTPSPPPTPKPRGFTRGTRYRLAANLGGRQSRVALDIADAGYPTPPPDPLVESILTLQAQLNSLSGVITRPR